MMPRPPQGHILTEGAHTHRAQRHPTCETASENRLGGRDCGVQDSDPADSVISCGRAYARGGQGERGATFGPPPFQSLLSYTIVEFYTRSLFYSCR